MMGQESILAAIALITAFIGLLKEIFTLRSSTSPNKIWVLVWLVIVVSICVTLVYINKVSHPVVFLFNKINSYDNQTKKYGFTQVQSYYQPWSLLSNTTLEKTFTEVNGQIGTTQPSIQTAYFASDLFTNEASVTTVSKSVHKSMKPDEQHHIIIEAKNAMSSGSLESNDWYDCKDWTGFNYKLTGPKKLNELLVVIDFSPLADSNGECTHVFKTNTQPKFVHTKEISKEDFEKQLGNGPIQDVCGGSAVYKDMTNITKSSGENQFQKEFYGKGCLWVGRLKSIEDGRVSVIWNDGKAN